MARPSAKDPLDKFRWSVSIDGFTRLGFTSVDVPSFTVTSKSYAEGGSHLFPRKIIESIAYNPITLQRGVTGDSSFLEWARSIFNPVLGVVGADGITPDISGSPEYRREVQIVHLNRAGRPVITYTLHNAYPIEYKPASEFSADSDDTYSIEKLVLEYESFEVSITGQKNNPFSIKDITKRLIRNL